MSQTPLATEDVNDTKDNFTDIQIDFEAQLKSSLKTDSDYCIQVYTHNETSTSTIQITYGKGNGCSSNPGAC